MIRTRNPVARALRNADPEICDVLRASLREGLTIAEVAVAFGFAGETTLWRIARETPAVRAIIDQCGRRRGRPRKDTTNVS